MAIVPNLSGAPVSGASRGQDTPVPGETGDIDEVAPISDTAPSGLNGRMQRLAQHLSTIIAFFFAAGTAVSGKLGPLIQGASSSGAVTYSSGQIHPLSLKTAGGLRTHVQPDVAGGYTHARLQSAATTNATSVKATAGQVYAIEVGNNHATNVAYLKLYNKASAPTVGTDTPVETILLPPRVPRDIVFDAGAPFTTGIAYAITGAAGDADTTAVALDQVTGAIKYN